MLKAKTKSLLEIILVIILFIFFSYIIQTNLAIIQNIMQNNMIGMLIYLSISIIAIVIAPISTLPLLPVASTLWGWQTAGLLSIVGWAIGSLIAFILARKYGVPLIKKFISIEKITEIEKSIPKENVFWSIVFLRMVIPVDILSYALGLFSKIKTRPYFIATIIGITPFAFVFAYLGELPFYYHLAGLVIALILILIGLTIHKRKVRK